MVTLVAEYVKINEEIKRLKARLDYLKSILINEHGEGSHIVENHEVIITKQVQQRINTELVKQVIPSDKLPKYLKNVEFIKVIVKEKLD